MTTNSRVFPLPTPLPWVVCGARRVCAVLSLIETCKLLRVDACADLAWALRRLVPHPDNRGFQTRDLTPRPTRRPSNRRLLSRASPDLDADTTGGWRMPGINRQEGSAGETRWGRLRVYVLLGGSSGHATL